MGRWLEPTTHCGNAMNYYIIADNNQVIGISTVNPSTDSSTINPTVDLVVLVSYTCVK